MIVIFKTKPTTCRLNYKADFMFKLVFSDVFTIEI